MLYYGELKHIWFTGVGVASMSVYGCARRTNNFQEAFNRDLSRLTRGNRPGIWQFTSECLQFSDNIIFEYNFIKKLY